MIHILQDIDWTFVGALFTIIAVIAAILVPIIIYLAQRKRKSLAYEIVASTPLLSVAEEIKGKLKILYEDKPVSKVHLVLIKLTNTGNVSILSTDFDRNVSFSFGDSTQILTAEVSDTDPKNNIDACIMIIENRIILENMLFNNGDSVTIKALLNQFDEEIEIDGHIVGIKEIEKRKERKDREKLNLFISIFMGISMLSYILGLVIPSIRTPSIVIAGFSLSIVLIIFMIFSIKEAFTILFPPPSR